MSASGGLPIPWFFSNPATLDGAPFGQHFDGSITHWTSRNSTFGKRALPQNIPIEGFFLIASFDILPYGV